jgi:hypothetical protein
VSGRNGVQLIGRRDEIPPLPPDAYFGVDVSVPNQVGISVVVGLSEEALGGGLKIDDAFEDAALEPLPGQLGEATSQQAEG